MTCKIQTQLIITQKSFMAPIVLGLKYLNAEI